MHAIAGKHDITICMPLLGNITSQHVCHCQETQHLNMHTITRKCGISENMHTIPRKRKTTNECTPRIHTAWEENRTGHTHIYKHWWNVALIFLFLRHVKLMQFCSKCSFDNFSLIVNQDVLCVKAFTDPVPEKTAT